VNVISDNPWSGSGEVLLVCSSPVAGQLPEILRGRLRDTNVSVLSEDMPEEWARCLARLTGEAQPIAGESASAPLA
jgi:hypothetical protein